MSSRAETPSGGDTLPNADAFAVGDAVLDREDDDANTATVINLPPVSCADWEVGETTVADMNPDHDPDDDVVVVAFDEDLAEYQPGWSGDEPLPLAEADVYFYAFPPTRLARVETGSHEPHGDETPEEASTAPAAPLAGYDALRALRDRLAENGEVDVLRDRGEPVLAIVKLGVEHRIRPDGSVSDGPLADRLRDVAAEYLGGEP